MVESPRWQVNQKVSWPKVAPYTIARLVGEAGNIHITPEGKYHVYWHRELPDGTSTIVHHGGPLGFGTLGAVMHQHERVILGYTGLTIEPSISDSTFPQLIAEMKTLVLPGEQRRINKYIETLQDTTRDLPQVTNHGQLAGIRENLDKLSQDLSKAINPYKKGARISLEKGLRGSKGQLLSGVNEAQILLLQRARQTVSIVVGTMQRYNALERLQIDWNRVVEGLPGMAGQLIITLQSRDLIDSDRLDRALSLGILHKDISFEAQLLKLQGEPYFSRAQQLIDRLFPLRKLWEERNYQEILRVLSSQAPDMEIWKRRIREEQSGINFGKYNLT